MCNYLTKTNVKYFIFHATSTPETIIVLFTPLYLFDNINYLK